MRYTILFLAALLLALSPSAYSQGFNGIDLYKACNNIGGYADNQGVCLGYLRGFTEGLMLHVQSETI